jgi:hypothetical protein
MTITSEQRNYPGFPGKIGRTREESEPHWNLPVRPPAGSPNIVIVLMDDRVVPTILLRRWRIRESG